MCSLNVRGLSNNSKRRETFLWLGKTKFSIYFLQETRSTSDSEAIWRSEWGYLTIFTNFSRSRAGVCILFNNNFHFNILRSFTDPEGRVIIADIETKGEILTLVNVYAPNQPTFFEKLDERLTSFEFLAVTLT